MVHAGKTELQVPHYNKNKLMVHVYMYIVINTTIFLIVCLLLLRYNYINVGHLQVVHEALNDKLYLHVSGEFTVCGVGWVRDLVLCL
jgi:hypothetical protein